MPKFIMNLSREMLAKTLKIEIIGGDYSATEDSFRLLCSHPEAPSVKEGERLPEGTIVMELEDAGVKLKSIWVRDPKKTPDEDDYSQTLVSFDTKSATNGGEGGT